MISIKNERELEAMRQACKITAAARALAGEMVRPGVSTRAIDHAVHDYIVSQGAKPSFLNYNGYPASVCVSVNDEIIHGIPGKRVLQEGDIVSVDVGATFKGFVGDCAGTFPCGEVSEDAKKLLIEHNLRLVVYISRRFENTGVNLEDLISIGTIGLIKAINTFKSDKNIKLATYASRCIENEILMYLRKINNQRSEVSFDEPLNTDWDGNELLLSDVLGTDSDEVYRPLEDDADRQMLMSAIESLGEREQCIIIHRFGLNGISEKTQKEVADLMGISQSYISRLEKRIICKLRRSMQKMM